MKIALICDWLINIAGSEKVLGEMLQCFPTADVFAVVDFLPSHLRGFLNDKPVKTTFIQKLPFARKQFRHYLPFMPLAIEQLDVSSYDVVISSSHAVAKGIITGPNQVHISYIHTPMRYAWDLQHQYLKDSGLDTGIKGYIAKKILHKLRIWDQRTANGVDHFIANSNFIARRIQKTYRRDANVIYPPVDINQFKPYQDKADFYLTASRMVPYKKMDLIVESFAHMPDKKLIVIGDGIDFAKIKAKATQNTILLGYQPTDALIHYMQRAKAFIFAAEEDFGLIPVEAMACGTPVIAYAKGGVLETVNGLDQEKPTGLFFKEQTTSSLCTAVREFEFHHSQLLTEHCVEQAKKFAPENFRNQFKAFVIDKLKC